MLFCNSHKLHNAHESVERRGLAISPWSWPDLGALTGHLRAGAISGRGDAVKALRQTQSVGVEEKELAGRRLAGIAEGSPVAEIRRSPDPVKGVRKTAKTEAKRLVGTQQESGMVEDWRWQDVHG